MTNSAIFDTENILCVLQKRRDLSDKIGHGSVGGLVIHVVVALDHDLILHPPNRIVILDAETQIVIHSIPSDVLYPQFCVNLS